MTDCESLQHELDSALDDRNHWKQSHEGMVARWQAALEQRASERAAHAQSLMKTAEALARIRVLEDAAERALAWLTCESTHRDSAWAVTEWQDHPADHESACLSSSRPQRATVDGAIGRLGPEKGKEMEAIDRERELWDYIYHVSECDECRPRKKGCTGEAMFADRLRKHSTMGSTTPRQVTGRVSDGGEG